LNEVFQQPLYPRTEWDQLAFVNLRSPDDQKPALEIDVSDSQPADLSDPRSQAIGQRKDSAVSHPAQGSAGVVFQVARRAEQGAGSRTIKDALIGSSRSGILAILTKLVDKYLHLISGH
jgi:hypothetical protein